MKDHRLNHPAGTTGIRSNRIIFPKSVLVKTFYSLANPDRFSQSFGVLAESWMKKV